jgi:hypothetical protein
MNDQFTPFARLPDSLTRLATWSLPWLASLVISACIAYSMTAMVAGAQSSRAEAALDNSLTTAACASTDDRMLAYAVSTHRVPAATSACAQDRS